MAYTFGWKKSLRPKKLKIALSILSKKNNITKKELDSIFILDSNDIKMKVSQMTNIYESKYQNKNWYVYFFNDEDLIAFCEETSDLVWSFYNDNQKLDKRQNLIFDYFINYYPPVKNKKVIEQINYFRTKLKGGDIDNYFSSQLDLIINQLEENIEILSETEIYKNKTIRNVAKNLITIFDNTIKLQEKLERKEENDKQRNP